MIICDSTPMLWHEEEERCSNACCTEAEYSWVHEWHVIYIIRSIVWCTVYESCIHINHSTIILPWTLTLFKGNICHEKHQGHRHINSKSHPNQITYRYKLVRIMWRYNSWKHAIMCKCSGMFHSSHSDNKKNRFVRMFCCPLDSITNVIFSLCLFFWNPWNIFMKKNGILYMPSGHIT